MNRRGFITAAASFLCAPAIVRASSIMPVRALPFHGDEVSIPLNSPYLREFMEADDTQLARMLVQMGTANEPRDA